ncbi:MAG: hypothetical protein U0835_14630 [Isosphaeraceae bacterium]
MSDPYFDDLAKRLEKKYLLLENQNIAFYKGFAAALGVILVVSVWAIAWRAATDVIRGTEARALTERHLADLKSWEDEAKRANAKLATLHEKASLDAKRIALLRDDAEKNGHQFMKTQDIGYHGIEQRSDEFFVPGVFTGHLYITGPRPMDHWVFAIGTDGNSDWRHSGAGVEPIMVYGPKRVAVQFVKPGAWVVTSAGTESGLIRVVLAGAVRPTP